MTLTHHLTHTQQQLKYMREQEAELQRKLTDVQTMIASHELAIKILEKHDTITNIDSRDS